MVYMVPKGEDDEWQGCHNCEYKHRPDCVDNCNWTPDSLTKLEKHIENKPEPEWCDEGGKSYDMCMEPTVEEWMAELEKLFAEVKERYRRD